MKRMNKMAVALLAFCMLLTAMLFMVSCKPNEPTNEPCKTHADANEDGKCDVCGAEVEVETCDDHIDTDGDNLCEICGAICVLPLDCTFVLKDEDGRAMASVSLTLRGENDMTVEAVTDAQGTIAQAIVPGKYTVNFEGLAEGWYVEGNASVIEIAEGAVSFDFVAIDNNPDGSEEKPYYVGDESVSLTFGAGMTYNYFTRGTSSRYLVIENANAKVSYDGKDYLPENGVIKILVTGAADTNSTMPFTVTNTAEGENTIAIRFESIPGTQDNPFVAELGQSLTANVPAESAIYYSFTAQKDGYLVLTSETVTNNIMMYNLTSYVVTGYTDGGKSVCILVAAGDVVSITVSTKGSESVNLVQFKLELYSGAAEDPIPVFGSNSIRLAANGSVALVYHGEGNTMSVPADGLALTLNDSVQEITGGNYIFTVADGDVISLTNTTGERVDVGFILS